MVRIFIIFILITNLVLCTRSFAQDLEPRRWTPVPLGMQVFGVGYGYAGADIEFDPVMQVKDAELTLQVVGVSYVTSFKIANKLARFDVTIPWASGKWQGLLAEQPTEIQRNGFLDPVFRVSINLLGSPALKSDKLIPYLRGKTSNTIIGAAISITAPLGEYHKDKLINLGQNRYTVRPQIGLLHTQGKWSYELTGSIFIYSDNDDFYVGKLRQQKPLYAIQSHVIHSLAQGKWISASVGYGIGGQSTIEGINKNDKRHTLLSAVSFGMPISRTQSIKIAYINQKSNSSTGLDSDSLVLAWSKRF
ncbi:MAG: transporter [Saccharospirillaceae bacterium]|nr:transporter [Colwellia sp.]NRB77297.1 transporter [Saccharospirillaceae bacterium]